VTPADHAKARRALMRADPVLAEVIRQVGPCGLAESQHTDPFVALTRAIIGQQLSTKAAATIAGRFHALFGRSRPTAAKLAAIPDDALRGVGLSRMKLSFLRDLGARVLDGSLALRALGRMSDDEVVETLVAVKGIGRWTAEMFLMFRLHRPDVLPVGDLGIVRAIQRVYGLRTVPSVARITRMGEVWRPYRSVACWYLWASLDNAPAALTTKKGTR
jgi:DNA-3-methyladenine glycosylase II